VNSGICAERHCRGLAGALAEAYANEFISIVAIVRCAIGDANTVRTVGREIADYGYSVIFKWVDWGTSLCKGDDVYGRILPVNGPLHGVDSVTNLRIGSSGAVLYFNWIGRSGLKGECTSMTYGYSEQNAEQ